MKLKFTIASDLTLPSLPIKLPFPLPTMSSVFSIKLLPPPHHLSTRPLTTAFRYRKWNPMQESLQLLSNTESDSPKENPPSFSPQTPSTSPSSTSLSSPSASLSHLPIPPVPFPRFPSKSSSASQSSPSPPQTPLTNSPRLDTARFFWTRTTSTHS